MEKQLHFLDSQVHINHSLKNFIFPEYPYFFIDYLLITFQYFGIKKNKHEKYEEFSVFLIKFHVIYLVIIFRAYGY